MSQHMSIKILVLWMSNKDDKLINYYAASSLHASSIKPLCNIIKIRIENSYAGKV